MNLFQLDVKYFLRSPIMWVILSITAFISAWIFLLSIDLFTQMQFKFANMSDAPTVMDGVVIPVIMAQAKLLILVASIVGGLSFSRLSVNNGWHIIGICEYTDFQIIMQKYRAALLICLLFISPSVLSICAIGYLAEIELLPILMVLLGLGLLLLWMLALTLFISAIVNNTGFAILLCVVVLILLWLMNLTAGNGEWGKNWIQVFSPQYHFHGFIMTDKSILSWATILYFPMGAVVFLSALRLIIIHKRQTLA